MNLFNPQQQQAHFLRRMNLTKNTRKYMFLLVQADFALADLTKQLSGNLKRVSV